MIVCLSSAESVSRMFSSNSLLIYSKVSLTCIDVVCERKRLLEVLVSTKFIDVVPHRKIIEINSNVYNGIYLYISTYEYQIYLYSKRSSKSVFVV